LPGLPWEEVLDPLMTLNECGLWSGRGVAKGRAGGGPLNEADGPTRSLRAGSRAATSSSSPCTDSGDGGDRGEVGVIVLDEDEDTFENDMNGALGGESSD
jgi:hypothetical protein